MKHKIIAIFIFGILLIGMVSAHSEEDFSQAEAIIEQNIPCDQLSNQQLELIGDYYMERMHPGEAHEYMDQMMGGGDSESLEAMHINMALRIYCGETGYQNYQSYKQGYGSYGMRGMMYSGLTSQSRVYSWLNIFLIIVIAAIIVAIAILTTKKKHKKNEKQ
jgi:hypothetical protein